MLTVSNLSLGYNKKPIVTLPEFALEAGQHCLVSGTSGTGKTTLLYALGGLITPLGGSILLDGKDITRMGAGQRDNFRATAMGIVFQTLHMVKALAVLDNLLLVRYAAGLEQDKAAARHMLALMGIEALADRLPEQLSQGQQQRVAIARAAMNSPKLILADEPTSALDDAACEGVMKLLFSVAEQSNAVLVVATHDARIRGHFTRQLMLEEVCA